MLSTLLCSCGRSFALHSIDQRDRTRILSSMNTCPIGSHVADPSLADHVKVISEQSDTIILQKK